MNSTDLAYKVMGLFMKCEVTRLDIREKMIEAENNILERKEIPDYYAVVEELVRMERNQPFLQKILQ